MSDRYPKFEPLHIRVRNAEERAAACRRKRALSRPSRRRARPAAPVQRGLLAVSKAGEEALREAKATEDQASPRYGKCAICPRNALLELDHCHATGLARGLICRQCNMGLGNFHDDSPRLMTAIEYLKVWGAVHAAGAGVRYELVRDRRAAWLKAALAERVG